jgi:uncharacterized protein (TIGR03067 family)
LPGATAVPTPTTSTASVDLAEKDLAKLQGTWRIETSLWNGVREPDIARSVTILFQGNKFIVIDQDGNRQEETIQLMPDQNPKAIDCSSKGDSVASPGIYSLEGDVFTWCSAGGDKKARPTSFASKPRSKHRLMVLRREKS